MPEIFTVPDFCQAGALGSVPERDSCTYSSTQAVSG